MQIPRVCARFFLFHIVVGVKVMFCLERGFGERRKKEMRNNFLISFFRWLESNDEVTAAHFILRAFAIKSIFMYRRVASATVEEDEIATATN